MAKLSKVAMTFKNYMDLFPDSEILNIDDFGIECKIYEYSFTYKNLKYVLSFLEYYDVYSKTYHITVTLTYSNKVITLCKHSTLQLRHNILNLLTALYGIKF